MSTVTRLTGDPLLSHRHLLLEKPLPLARQAAMNPRRGSSVTIERRNTSIDSVRIKAERGVLERREQTLDRRRGMMHGLRRRNERPTKTGKRNDFVEIIACK